MLNQTIWGLKYRPVTIDACVLPEPIKARFRTFARTKAIPHLLLSGPAGVGKTTIARALVAEMDADTKLVNASLHGNIDTLRTEILEYATSLSFGGGRKFVILDEADNLSGATQLALRGFMDGYAENCGFILTANYPERLLVELRSRCDEIRFDIGVAMFPVLAAPFVQRLVEILGKEKIDSDLRVLVSLVRQQFPDFRKTINILQGYAAEHGNIDSGILATPLPLAGLVAAIRSRSFAACEEWLVAHHTVGSDLFRAIYDARSRFCPPSSYPALVERLATYQFQHSVAADKHINLLACLSSIIEGVPLDDA